MSEEVDRKKWLFGTNSRCADSIGGYASQVSYSQESECQVENSTQNRNITRLELKYYTWVKA